MGGVTVWFSYRTIVAFHANGYSRVVHENDWGRTTGKHLTWIDGGDQDARRRRVDDTTFQLRWAEQVCKVPLVEVSAICLSSGGPSPIRALLRRSKKKEEPCNSA
jgi:hypothetical protein